MTDWKPIPIITNDDLARYHIAKKVTNAACSRCGNAQWTVLSSSEAAMSGLPTAHTDERADVDLFTPVLTLVCTNCGTLWMTSGTHILQWLAEHPKEGSASGNP